MLDSFDTLAPPKKITRGARVGSDPRMVSLATRAPRVTYFKGLRASLGLSGELVRLQPLPALL